LQEEGELKKEGEKKTTTGRGKKEEEVIHIQESQKILAGETGFFGEKKKKRSGEKDF